MAFDSFATNLVTGGTNGRRHIFVHDRQSGQTELVSVRGNGEQGNHDSANPSISADGRYVAFRSDASNLVANDSNGAADIFVHDRQTGQTALVSVSSGGAPGDQDSLWPSISDDGLLVAFYSHATNLVAGDANGVEDVFVRDLDAGTTTMVSVDGTGTQGNDSSVRPAISGNGRHVAFRSEATNLVDGDGNEVGDMFVHDLQTSHTSRVSIAAGGVEANGESDLPALSADGRLVAFSSEASNLGDNDTNGVADIFVYDTQLESIEVVSAAGDGTVGNGASDDATISDDGNLVAYDSLASNLVGGDTNGARDVFVHDLQSGATWRVSISNTNIQGNADSQEPALSGNGDAIAFYSYASNLVGNDTNGVADVFVYEGD